MKETLSQIIARVIEGENYCSDWGIWAEIPFDAESAARSERLEFYGTSAIENMKFFATYAEILDDIASYCDGSPEEFDLEEKVSAVVESRRVQHKQRL
jgi:hypothetical protein